MKTIIGGAEQINPFAAADIEINMLSAANIQATTGDGRIAIDGVAGELILRSDARQSLISDEVATVENANEEARVRRWRVGSGGTLFTLRTADWHIVLRRHNATTDAGTRR